MFDLIFSGLQDGEVSVWPLATSGPQQRIRVPVAKAHTIMQTFQSQTDIYFGPAVRRSGTTDDKKESILGSRVVWVDGDVEQYRATFPASILVHSGHGWHAYYLLDNLSTDIAAIEAANKFAERDVMEKTKCWDIGHFLRVPGTLNGKEANQKRPVELRLSRPLFYKLEDFGVLEVLDDKTKHKIRTGDIRGYNGDRSRRDWAIVTGLVEAGASDNLIEIIFRFQPCGDKYRDPDTDGVQYLGHTIQRARDRPAAKARRTTGQFIEGEHGYFLEGAKGIKKLSTFVFKPRMLIQGDKEDAIVGTMCAEGYSWPNITLKRSAFNDRRSLDAELHIGAWVWLGRDDDVRTLLTHLMAQLRDNELPKTRATSILGRNGKYFVGPNQTVGVSDLFQGVDAPLVYLNTAKNDLPIEYKEPTGELRLGDLLKINTPDVVWSILGWFMACPYKPMIERLGVRFPILNVSGTKGSGKTSLLRVMQRLSGYSRPTSFDCNTTRFVMLSLLGISTTIPVSFAEFRWTVAEKILRFVLMAYDSGHDSRGTGQQTIIDYPLLAPFHIDGEDVIADPAARERIIAVILHPETIAEGTPAFDAFRRINDEPLENFIVPYLQHVLRSDPEALLKEARDAIRDAFPETLPDRVRNNLTVVTFGILSFCKFLGAAPPSIREVLEPSLAVVWSKEAGRGSTIVDQFVEHLVNAVAQNQAKFIFDVRDNVVWFQLATAFDWWSVRRRAQGNPTLDRDAIRNQLLERHVNRQIDKGQYVVGPKVVKSAICFGIDIAKAIEAGIDIPSNINVNVWEVPVATIG